MSELLDWLGDPRRLADRIPRWKERFDATREIRITNELAFGFGRDQQGAGSRRVASIPDALLSALLGADPEFLTNKAHFYAFLDAHPEFSCIRREGKS